MRVCVRARVRAAIFLNFYRKTKPRDLAHLRIIEVKAWWWMGGGGMTIFSPLVFNSSVRGLGSEDAGAVKPASEACTSVISRVRCFQSTVSCFGISPSMKSLLLTGPLLVDQRQKVLMS